jgi:hypothetical protein
MSNPQNYQIEFPLFAKEKRKAEGEDEAGEYLVGSPSFPCEIDLSKVFFLVFFDQEFPKLIIRSVNAPKKVDKKAPTPEGV